MAKTASSKDAKKQWDDDVKRVVPSNFTVLSSCADHEESAESYNTRKFQLPNPAGKCGSACISAFLKHQYESTKEVSWVEGLKEIGVILKARSFEQTPSLSSSRKLNDKTMMKIASPHCGTKRALLIGINYVGQVGELKACHNDCLNVKRFLIEKHKFPEKEMVILMDDGLRDHLQKKTLKMPSSNWQKSADLATSISSYSPGMVGVRKTWMVTKRMVGIQRKCAIIFFFKVFRRSAVKEKDANTILKNIPPSLASCPSISKPTVKLLTMTSSRCSSSR
jgi:Caspase domain